MIAPVTIPPIASVDASRSTSATTPPAPSRAANATLLAAPTGSAENVGRANPTFQFNPAAGVLVIQFRDDSGKVALSIPSQQQIQAYATDRVEGQTPSNGALIA